VLPLQLPPQSPQSFITSRIHYEYDQYPQDSQLPITFGIHLETPSAQAIQSRYSPQSSNRKIVFVIDTSKSMDANIKLLKQIMHKVISISIGNTIGIVAFNSVVDVLCPMTKLVSESDIENLKQTISQLSTSGYTNICDGILTGMDILWSDVLSKSPGGDGTERSGDGTERSGDGTERSGNGTERSGNGTESKNMTANKNGESSDSQKTDKIGDTDNHRRFLVLLTDGEANTGCTEINKIRLELSSCPQASETDIYAIALGNDVNQDLLQQLTTAYNGKLYSVENSQQLWVSFGDCMGSIMSTFIRNLSITVRFDGHHVDISTDYPNVSQEPSALITRVGTLFFNDSRDFLFTLTRHSDHCFDTIHVEISFVDSVSEKESIIQHTIDPKFSSEIQSPQGRNPEIRKQQLRIEVSKLTADWSTESQERLNQIANEIQAEQWQNDFLCSDLLSAIRIAPSIPHIGRRSLSIEFATQRHIGDYYFSSTPDKKYRRMECGTADDSIVASIGRELGVVSIPTEDVTIFTQLSQSSSQEIPVSQEPLSSSFSQEIPVSQKRTSSQVGFCE
jgi:Mg-chelatase subunit ChlD